jgi:hypothetical protein
MITPLAQRQIFQTAHTEVANKAQEVSGQLARDAAFKKVMDERFTEEQASVHTVPKSEGLRIGERGAKGGQEEHPGREKEPEEDAGEPAPEASAGSAEGHLDLLA